MDSTNVKLGLVVTGNINNTVSAKLRTAKHFSLRPIGSNYYSFRNNLHGNKEADDTKRLKLEIYYTKSN
jgi:hypothetical protein